jgi:hypothetical protein
MLPTITILLLYNVAFDININSRTRTSKTIQLWQSSEPIVKLEQERDLSARRWHGVVDVGEIEAASAEITETSACTNRPDIAGLVK